MSNIKNTLKITGMTCGHCKKAVKNILREQKGVLQVEVVLENAVATVVFDDTQTSLEALKKAINNSGIFNAL